MTIYKESRTRAILVDLLQKALVSGLRRMRITCLSLCRLELVHVTNEGCRSITMVSGSRMRDGVYDGQPDAQEEAIGVRAGVRDRRLHTHVSSHEVLL